MPSLTLQHCHPVAIPVVPPGDTTVTVPSAGNSGDGSLEISGGPTSVSQECGTPGSHSLPGADTIAFHYKKSPTGPESIEIEYDIATP